MNAITPIPCSGKDFFIELVPITKNLFFKDIINFEEDKIDDLYVVRLTITPKMIK
jgi:hypothetical protein